MTVLPVPLGNAKVEWRGRHAVRRRRNVDDMGEGWRRYKKTFRYING